MPQADHSQPQTLTIERVNYAALVEEASGVLEVSNEIVIDSQSMYELASEELGNIKKRIKELEDRRKAITSPLTDAHKSVMDLFRPPLDLLGKAKTSLSQGMITYVNDQEKKRREEEAIRLAEIRKQQAIIEEQEREAAEKLANATTAKERQEAIRLQGEVAAAAAVQAAPVATVAPKAQGTSVRKTWKGRCVNKAELIAYVAANPAFSNLLVVDDKVLNNLAKAHGDTFNIPGCEAYEDSTIATRTK